MKTDSISPIDDWLCALGIFRLFSVLKVVLREILSSIADLCLFASMAYTPALSLSYSGFFNMLWIPAFIFYCSGTVALSY